MKLTIENFGPIKKPIVIEPKALTVFCGANNTGKTYALYVLNALMDSRLVANFDLAKVHAKTLFQEKHFTIERSELLGPVAIRHAEKNIAHSLKNVLPQFFVADGSITESAKLSLQLDAPDVVAPLFMKMQSRLHSGGDKEGVIGYHADASSPIKFSIAGDWDSAQQVESAFNRLLMGIYLPNRSGRDFLLPAERSGINLFFRELNSRRAALLRHVTSQTLDTNELLKDIIVSRYPQPIHDYIEFLNSQPEIKRQQSEFADLAAWLQKEVLRAKYKVDRYGDISIAPLRSGGAEMGLHLGSSTVKTFFGLWSYLNHLARQGDWLMIDEPELNLHPQNQRAIAQLLAQLVNRGIRVIVSTHSDYMVREWSNLIMLGSQDFEGRDALSEQYALPKSQWLNAAQVAAIEFDGGGATPMVINMDSGIRTDLFDASIMSLNKAAQDIYFARQSATPRIATTATARKQAKRGTKHDGN
jgi:AAA domain, putative AbiEii toxin, Type IV TA system/AAA ATPase domain